MILEQELQIWVGKIGVGIGLFFFGVGNTLFHSIIQLLAGLSRGYIDFQKNWDRQTDGQTDRQTDSGVCRVAPQLKM